MNIVSINKGTDFLDKVPKPPIYLSDAAKVHYKEKAKILISYKKLKRLHLPALEILAENLSQWEWAVREIKRKNQVQDGSGYKQIFKSNAENISVELTIKRDAEKAIMTCFKQFGIDPKSEKELDSSQLELPFNMDSYLKVSS